MNAKTQKQMSKKSNAQRRGQGMTEYVIVVALIAIAAITAITFFGNNLRDVFGASAGALAGSATANTAQVGASSGSKNLKTFSQTGNATNQF
jgi:Flp pilus assembly pilin Flp